MRERYLERDGKVIHLGLRLFELGQLAEQPRELRAAALPVMADLRNTTGETVSLAIRDGHEMVCIAVMRGHASAAPDRHASAGGSRLMPPRSARRCSRSPIAADVDAVVSSGLAAWTPQTIIDPER